MPGRLIFTGIDLDKQAAGVTQNRHKNADTSFLSFDLNIFKTKVNLHFIAGIDLITYRAFLRYEHGFAPGLTKLLQRAQLAALPNPAAPLIDVGDWGNDRGSR